MRIAVMGAGAVGGYFGAKLAASHNVAFIARGEHLEAMRLGGLRVLSPRGDLHIQQSQFTSDPAQVGAVDLVLFCVKSYDTDALASALSPMINDRSIILSLQNGIDNPDKIARLWGNPKTLAGVVYLGAQVAAPGTILHSAGGQIVLGELDGGLRESTKAVLRALSTAQIPCEISTEIRRVQWRKLLWNAPFCAISSLTRATVKQILESESLRQLAVACMNEVREAAATQGLELEPELIEETLGFSRSLGDFKPSMLQDLETGKPLEYEAFNGIVVDLLRGAGKEAPINQVFHGTLKHLNKGISGG